MVSSAALRLNVLSHTSNPIAHAVIAYSIALITMMCWARPKELPSTRVPMLAGSTRSIPPAIKQPTVVIAAIFASRRHTAGGVSARLLLSGIRTIGIAAVSIPIGAISAVAPRRAAVVTGLTRAVTT